MKIVAVLYPGGDAADNPEVLGCAENALGLRDSLGDEHELVSTTEREGEELLGHLRDAEVGARDDLRKIVRLGPNIL